MRSSRWQLAFCLVGLVTWPALRVHADAPLRLAVRVASEQDRALLPRLRGQLSDTDTQLIVLETPPLEAALPDQIALARRLAQEHHAAAFVWCGQHLLHILLAGSDRILSRELTSSAQETLSSSALETAALLVRSALIALAQNAELGQPTREVLAAASGSPEPNGRTASDVSPPTAAPADTGSLVLAPSAGALPGETSSRAGAAASDAATQSVPSARAARQSELSASAPEQAAQTTRGARASELSAPDTATPWVIAPSVESGARSVDTAAPEQLAASEAAPAPLRARLALGAQLAVDGQSIAGQRGLYASAGVGFAGWTLGVFGVVSLASELADEYFALNVARHALGIAVERQLPLSDAWVLGLAAHAGALLLRRSSVAKSSAVVSYPASLVAAFAFGPELALSWLRGRFGVALRVGLDVLPDAPRFESAGLSPQHARIAHPLWMLQPRVMLGWEATLP